MDAKIATVLISTFNGEKNLRTQVDSIIAQKSKKFTVCFRDDGSTDETLNIINNYCRKLPSFIKVEDAKGNIGVKNSFDELLKKTTKEYSFFSDQDDFWLPNKTEELLNIILGMEVNKPCLVFSDMDIIDINQGKTIKNFLKKKLLVTNSRLNKGFLQGHISGCLMLFNKKAVDLYLKYNTNKALHDYHMLMICSIFGSVRFVEKSLISHIIHKNNFLGMGNKPSLLIELKDLVKYLFKNAKYRSIVFSFYFEYIAEIRKYEEVDSYCIKKKYYGKKEILDLSYFNRKIWYYKHFFSLEKGLIREVIRLILF